MKKNKRGRKRIISIAVITVLTAIISVIVFFNIYNKTQRRMNGIMTKEEKDEMFLDQEKEKGKPKKNSGKQGDKKGPEIKGNIDIGKIIDCEKRVFPELKLKLEDESGIYTVKLNFIIGKKKLGFIQQTVNSKNKSTDLKRVIDDSIILDNMKTFKNYEGGELTVLVEASDNNLNKSTKEFKGIKIKDYTKPEIPEIMWTYKSRGKKAGEIYFNKDKKNSFVFKPVKDMPDIEGNGVKEYQYFIKNEEGKIVTNGKIVESGETGYMIKCEIIKDGKYKLIVRAFDLAGNFSESVTDFGVDTMNPFVKLDILEGQRFYIGDRVTIKIDAIDTLSGLYRYRMSDSKEGLLRAEWESIEKNVRYDLPNREGLYDVWCQVQDKAFNVSSAANISYAIVKDSSLKIKATSNEMRSKERVLRIDKDSYKKGKLQIESAEEK